MPKATLTISHGTDAKVLMTYYQEIKKIYYEKSIREGSTPFDFSDLDKLFSIACKSRDRFPNINAVSTEKEYLSRWVNDYYNAINNKPSTRTANPKSACSDPAIKKIVQMTQKLTNIEADTQESHHNMFMSAENIQGNLLEEYIAEKVHAYGWLWCAGTTLRAVDFCTHDGSYFLQVKNKSNTENSSSSNIREGTTIEKWYRLGTKTVSGKKVPDYKWNLLNTIINTNLPPDTDESLKLCSMSEDDYIVFLSNVATKNNSIITGK